mgnify:CR=1 FL=1
MGPLLTQKQASPETIISGFFVFFTFFVTEELFFVENDEARLAVRAVVDLALDWFVENVKAQEFLQQITNKTERTRKIKTSN